MHGLSTYAKETSHEDLVSNLADRSLQPGLHVREHGIDLGLHLLELGIHLGIHLCSGKKSNKIRASFHSGTGWCVLELAGGVF